MSLYTTFDNFSEIPLNIALTPASAKAFTVISFPLFILFELQLLLCGSHPGLVPFGSNPIPAENPKPTLNVAKGTPSGLSPSAIPKPP